MEKTDKEIIDNIQKFISEINVLLQQAADNDITCNIEQVNNIYFTYGKLAPPALKFEASKKLTKDYIVYSGGF